jgi:hypothetical protein
MLTGSVQPEVEVKWNILQNKEWCPFCDRNVCIDYGPWPFVRGTVRPVCVECAAEARRAGAFQMRPRRETD